MIKIEEYREKFNKLKIEKELLTKQYKQKNTDLREAKINYDNLLKAQEIIQTVVQETQNKIKLHITDIVNLAIDSIPFAKKPDYFDLEFVIRRNQTECDLFFVENEKRMMILSAGGGILDIVSFALQISCWSLQKGEKSNTIILDEPFKNINDPDKKYNLKQYVSELLKNISEKLHIQFIIVGSNNDFEEIGDRVFRVSLNEDNSSKVEVIK